MSHSRSFRSPRHRPPWWPENEPWPPLRRPPSRFFRRMGCLFLSFNLLGLAVLTGIIALIARSAGLVSFSPDLGQWLIPIGVGVVLFIVFVIGLGGAGLRRFVIPLDDLLKAADRVGKGDYSVQVQEKGLRGVRSLVRAFNDMASRLHLSDEKRRNLLADVTHELRTPLTVMQGNLEGMLDGVYPADEDNLRSLLEETNVLARLVEDLRTLALAESGALQLKKEPTDLALLARETAAAFEKQAKAAGVTLTVETSPDLPWLDLDPGRVRQVLSNLLANALRYTPTGGTISVRYHQVDGRAVLEVADSGSGIPPEEIPHVFERFYRSTDSGGMGLGLAIAKKLTEAHGGTITAESAPGAGTTMRVTLPIS
ncbi:MAG: HAMP domain-containing sensor histidine kinase [Chloroflexota bacterium]